MKNLKNLKKKTQLKIKKVDHKHQLIIKTSKFT